MSEKLPDNKDITYCGNIKCAHRRTCYRNIENHNYDPNFQYYSFANFSEDKCNEGEIKHEFTGITDTNKK